MNSLRISQLLLIFTVLLGILTAVQSFVMLKQTNKIRADLVHNVETLIPTVQKTNEAKIAIIQVQQWLTDISATRALDGLNDGFDEAALAADDFRTTIDALTKINPDNKNAYSKLIPIFEQYYKDGQKMAHDYIDGGPQSGNTTMALFDTSAASINNGIDDVLAQLEESIQSDLKHELEDISKSRFFILVFTLGFAALLTILLAVGHFRIVIPAKYLADELTQIAEGDFSRSVVTSKADEFGEIANAANKIVIQLGHSLRSITSAGMQVSAYAHALTYVIDEVQKNVIKQSEGTDTVVDSIHELSELGRTVVIESSQASEVSSEVKIQAQKGDKLLEDSLGATQVLAERMHKAKETVNELAQSSNKINEVMSVIQGIAEQTNLLALNAAIEAARAGEQGRGFAVVADEVRTLASRTQESASQIDTMIQNLQSRANETVDLITQNQEQATQNAEASKKAIEALRHIFQSIDNLDKLNGNITKASEAQSQKYQEVEEIIARSKEISDRFSTNAQQSERFGKALSANAQSFSLLATKLNVFD